MNSIAKIFSDKINRLCYNKDMVCSHSEGERCNQCRRKFCNNDHRSWMESKLFIAIRNKDISAAIALLKRGADCDARFLVSSCQKPAICISAENNDLEMTQVLLDDGAGVNQTDSNGLTPLHIAAINKNVELARLLLNNKASVHALDSSGQTPLHIAALRGSLGVVKLLINSGSGINVADFKEQTPLHMAVLGSEEVTLYLLRYGANPRWRDKYANCPIHSAVRTLGVSASTLRLLASLYPNALYLENKMKYTPLYTLLCVQRPDIVECVTALMPYIDDVSINMRSRVGQTPLQLSIAQRLYEVAKILIMHGAKLDIRDDLGHDPLSYAAYNDQVDCVKLLLSAGADARYVLGRYANRISNAEIKELLRIFAETPLPLSVLCRRVIHQNCTSTVCANVPNIISDFLSLKVLLWKELS